MSPSEPPLLYTFRRCPYAIRTRLALALSNTPYHSVEVSLKDKPAAMLAISPKGTVPVLQLSDGRVLEESLDIMLWALGQQDPDALVPRGPERECVMRLIARNDHEFKHHLDHYKYADRHPQHPASVYRDQAANFLNELEQLLGQGDYLGGTRPNLADIAIVPFVRQFAHVDRDWFYATAWEQLQRWLQQWLNSPVFTHVMAKKLAPAAAKPER